MILMFGQNMSERKDISIGIRNDIIWVNRILAINNIFEYYLISLIMSEHGYVPLFDF